MSTYSNNSWDDMGPAAAATTPLFKAYLFYVSLLCLKVLFMVTPLSSRLRIRKGVFPTPEDLVIAPNARVKYDDPDIERVRRAHLNDLENIPIFAILALLYVNTGPDYWTAVNLFRTFTAARVVHSFVYAVVVIPQPARALAWTISYIINVYLGVKAHLNDLENIPIFAILALLYVNTGPDYWTAVNLFRTFTAARVVHSFVYAVVVVPQPARALAWTISYIINVYLGVKVILNAL